MEYNKRKVFNEIKAALKILKQNKMAQSIIKKTEVGKFTKCSREQAQQIADGNKVAHYTHSLNCS